MHASGVQVPRQSRMLPCSEATFRDHISAICETDTWCRLFIPCPAVSPTGLGTDDPFTQISLRNHGATKGICQPHSVGSVVEHRALFHVIPILGRLCSLVQRFLRFARLLYITLWQWKTLFHRKLLKNGYLRYLRTQQHRDTQSNGFPTDSNHGLAILEQRQASLRLRCSKWDLS